MYYLYSGTGANLIYPLLGVSQFRWKFIASENNFFSYKNAKKIIKKNKLTERVKILYIAEGILDEISENFDISMCNPPFFEIGDNRTDGYGGNETEISTAGGELKFIKQYMIESYRKRKKVMWFTCLIGIKAHINKLELFLTKNFPISDHITTTLYQGKTLRWVIAWKFK